jgi:hypothetical protein
MKKASTSETIKCRQHPKSFFMAQKPILIAYAFSIIGLLLIEGALFCYSFYDPTTTFPQDWFPYRGFTYILLPLGAIALIIGTTYLLHVNEEKKE